MNDEPRGKKNPQMGQEAPTKSDPSKIPKSGVPQPWKAAHISNNTSPQLRPKKLPQKVITIPIPIFSSTPVVKEQPRPTLSARACFPASRIPCSISRLPSTGSSSGGHIRLKGGQEEKREKIRKHHNPSLGSPDLPMKRATLIKRGHGGLPPSVLGKEMLTPTNLPLKKEEISATPIQDSLKIFNKGPVLLSTHQVSKNQHGGEISSLASLSPSNDMMALLPPDELSLSTPEFLSDEVFISETPHCERHISKLGLRFPESIVQREMLPSYLSKHGKIPVEYPCPKRHHFHTYTILDFSPKEDSSKKNLEMFGSVSSTFSTEEFPESITGPSPSQDFVSPNCNDTPDTKILNSSYPLPSSSGMKEMVLSVFHDVSQEEELLLSSRTQIYSSIGSSNASALSPEENVLERMEEESDSGNGSEKDEDSSKYNPCILL